jgi:hypothetical protein
MPTVKVYDFDTQKVSEIPAAELAPGMVEAEVQGVGRVWVSSAQGKPSDKRRENLSPELLERVQKIKVTLDEVYPKTIEFWEDGFCRDMHPDREITIWERIASVYNWSKDFGKTLEARREIYRLVLACSSSSERHVLQVLDIKAISRGTAKEIIQRYYNGLLGEGSSN